LVRPVGKYLIRAPSYNWEIAVCYLGVEPRSVGAVYFRRSYSCGWSVCFRFTNAAGTRNWA